MNPERKIKVAVIGVGHVGQHHVRIYRELPGVELVGVVDIDPAKLQQSSECQGVAAFQDYRDLFGRVDAVSVAVPTVLHVPIARECLERDLDVLVEKPLAETLEEAGFSRWAMWSALMGQFVRSTGWSRHQASLSAIASAPSRSAGPTWM